MSLVGYDEAQRGLEVMYKNREAKNSLNGQKQY